MEFNVQIGNAPGLIRTRARTFSRGWWIAAQERAYGPDGTRWLPAAKYRVVRVREDGAGILFLHLSIPIAINPNPKRRKRVRTCVTHRWSQTGLKIAAQRAGVDGYRLLRRCRRCGRKVYDPFVAVAGALKG